MILQLLNFLHNNGNRKLLNLISRTGYRLKGYGHVKAAWRADFRAYEYRVQGVSYLSMGPGWAMSFDFLERTLLNTFCHLYIPRKGDCVIDLGAGLGEETVIYSIWVGKKGVVHALEANPVTYAGLNYLCKRNNFSQARAHHLAIYKEDTEVTIEDDPQNYLTNTIRVGCREATTHNVKAITLDSFVRQNGITRIDFLKSNVEGAEQFLIQGMDSAVGIIRYLCISCHDFRHRNHQHGEFYLTKQKVRLFLEEHGFEVSVRATGNDVIDDYIYARNTRIK